MHPNFTNLNIKLKKLIQYLRRLSIDYWLPIILVIVFVAQNHLFNSWVNIPIRHYFIRRTFVTASFGAMIFGLAILTNKHIRHSYLFLASLFISVVFIIQFLYYSYSGAFLQTSAIFYAGEGTTVLSTAKALLTYHIIFFIIGPLIVIASWLLNYKKIITERILNKQEKIWATIFILLFSISGYAYLFIREYKEAGNTAHLYQYNRLFDVNALESKLGIINFSIGDALTLGLKTEKATAADINFVKDYQKQKSVTTSTANFGLFKNRNLIFIQIESLENAVIGQEINGQEITPHLNKLANDGLYFSNYYSPIGPGTTADAEFMTLNSLYSLPNTVAFIQYAQNYYTALPELLKQNGYHAYAFHGDVASFWNRANIYPQFGYEKFFSKPDYTVPRKIGVYDLGDKDFFTQSIPKLKSLPQPFMATLITLTSHTPFEMPDDLKTLNFPTTSTLNKLQQNYLQSVRYTDEAVGEFIEQLKSTNLYDNSLILIFGDHGSFTNISGALDVKNNIFADLQPTEVPMIILSPKTKLKGVKNQPSSHLDVYPTVANLLGVKPPLDIFGHDMLDEKNSLVISRHLISGAIKSIVTSKIAYHTSIDGVFEKGACMELPSGKKLPTNNCRLLYEEKNTEVQTSDLMIKGNLITNKN